MAPRSSKLLSAIAILLVWTAGCSVSQNSNSGPERGPDTLVIKRRLFPKPPGSLWSVSEDRWILVLRDSIHLGPSVEGLHNTEPQRIGGIFGVSRDGHYVYTNTGQLYEYSDEDKRYKCVIDGFEGAINVMVRIVSTVYETPHAEDALIAFISERQRSGEVCGVPIADRISHSGGMHWAMLHWAMQRSPEEFKYTMSLRVLEEGQLVFFENNCLIVALKIKAGVWEPEFLRARVHP